MFEVSKLSIFEYPIYRYGKKESGKRKKRRKNEYNFYVGTCSTRCEKTFSKYSSFRIGVRKPIIGFIIELPNEASPFDRHGRNSPNVEIR